MTLGLLQARLAGQVSLGISLPQLHSYYSFRPTNIFHSPIPTSPNLYFTILNSPRISFSLLFTPHSLLLNDPFTLFTLIHSQPYYISALLYIFLLLLHGPTFPFCCHFLITLIILLHIFHSPLYCLLFSHTPSSHTGVLSFP